MLRTGKQVIKRNEEAKDRAEGLKDTPQVDVAEGRGKEALLCEVKSCKLVQDVDRKLVGARHDLLDGE